MKKVKKSSKSIKVTKRKINLKMAMLMGSVILIVAILVYGTLQKTFFAPKAAAPKRILTKSMYNKLYSATVNDCFSKYQYTYNAFSIAADQSRCPSHTFEVGKVWNRLSDWQYYGNWADLKIMSNKYVRCCVDMRGYVAESDQFCSMSDSYDSSGNYIGKVDMKCKPNCANPSVTDQNNLYKNGSYYFLRTGQNTTKAVTKSICGSAEMKYGKWKKVVGTCCAK